jgi:hypothetical protein
MNNEQIKSLVVPRLFENVGSFIVNKRNGIGRAFNLARNKPVTANALKQISETFNQLSPNDRFRIDEFITVIKNNYAYNTIQPIIEQALESNDEEQIVEGMKKVGSTIIKHLKSL